MTTPTTAPSTNARRAPYGTNAWEKQYRYDVACGRKRTVPAGPVRAHVRTLLDHDLTAASIAYAAGVCRATLTHLLRGRTTLKRDVADRLLAVTPEQVARDRPEPLVPRDGTVRRIHAVQALGWTYAHMEQVLRSAGYLQQPEKIVSPRSPHVTRETYDAICLLYTTLSNTRGPSQRAAALAAERGWVVPAAWDDDTIDDPSAGPETPSARPETAHDHLDEFAFLVRGGEAPDRAAHRAGYSSADSIGAVARRNDRDDVLRLMAETEYVDA
ncbi:hypothetical protein ACFQ80_06005 [Isoptericola sp. NPDC056578]|uniref:hypothetical protein n=1 Tax=Isoptericola sp. NPDC056578 TaxID=3345870 RepID=UPI0036BA89AB